MVLIRDPTFLHLQCSQCVIEFDGPKSLHPDFFSIGMKMWFFAKEFKNCYSILIISYACAKFESSETIQNKVFQKRMNVFLISGPKS